MIVAGPEINIDIENGMLQGKLRGAGATGKIYFIQMFTACFVIDIKFKIGFNKGIDFLQLFFKILP